MTQQFSSLIRRFWRCSFASVALLLAGAPAFAADCSIVSPQQVDSALPEYAPWHLYSGGPGGCRFEGTYKGSRKNHAVLSFSQQFHASSKAATDILNSVRKRSEKDYKLKQLKLPSVEPGSFLSSTDADGTPHHSMFWHVQVGQAIIIGSFSPPSGAPGATNNEAAVTSLLKIAVFDTRSPVTMEQSSQCPYFDDAALRKLIPGKLTVERFGENSCLASNDKNAMVLLSRSNNINTRTAENMLRSVASGCSFDRQASLGEYGGISHHCTSGNPRADVVFHKGNSYISISLAPNGEPTAKQREHLIELAQFVYNQ
jgi:hypothetical protein